MPALVAALSSTITGWTAGAGNDRCRHRRRCSYCRRHRRARAARRTVHRARKGVRGLNIHFEDAPAPAHIYTRDTARILHTAAVNTAVGYIHTPVDCIDTPAWLKTRLTARNTLAQPASRHSASLREYVSRRCIFVLASSCTRGSSDAKGLFCISVLGVLRGTDPVEPHVQRCRGRHASVSRVIRFVSDMDSSKAQRIRGSGFVFRQIQRRSTNPPDGAAVLYPGARA